MQTAFNCPNPPRFSRSQPDAYSKEARRAFYAQGCSVHSHFIDSPKGPQPCPLLPVGSTKAHRNMFGESYAELEVRFKKMVQRILAECSDQVRSVRVEY